jgi:hypothetical protein
MDTPTRPLHRDQDRREDLALDLTVTAVFALLSAAFFVIASL